MALIVADRILETTTTTGTGALTLDAAITGFRRFSAVCATNDTVYVRVAGVDGSGNPSGEWECGLYTYSSANTLTRTAVHSSSNSNNAVNFSAGTKHVALDATAVYLGSIASSGGFEAGPISPPTSADLATWDNQGTSTVTDGNGAMILRPQVDGILHGRYKTAPATPYDVYCRVDLHWLSTAAATTAISSGAGILFKDTGGDNERLSVGIYAERITGDENMVYGISCSRWTGASPPVAGTTPILKYTGQPWSWIRVNNDGTTLTVYASTEGRNWFTVGTELLSAHLDGAASFGVFSFASANATEAAAIFSYFNTTAPA